jgi:hypothetical protein
MALDLDFEYYTIENIVEKGLYWKNEPLTAEVLLRLAGDRLLNLYVEDEAQKKENGSLFGDETETIFSRVYRHDLRGAHRRPRANKMVRLCLDLNPEFSDIDIPFPPSWEKGSVQVCPIELVVFRNDLAACGVSDTEPDKNKKVNEERQHRLNLCVVLAIAANQFVETHNGHAYRHSDGRVKAGPVAEFIQGSLEDLYPDAGGNISHSQVRYALGTGLSELNGDRLTERGLRTCPATIQRAIAILTHAENTPNFAPSDGGMGKLLAQNLDCIGYEGPVDARFITETIREGRRRIKNPA